MFISKLPKILDKITLSSTSICKKAIFIRFARKTKINHSLSKY